MHQSGQHAYTDHITKTGNPTLRWLMTEVAWGAVRFDPHWKQVFERLQRRLGTSIAIIAIARKLLVVVYHLRIKHEPYARLQPQAFVRKLQGWA